ncbi:uncharacterized protein LOC119455475 isoform X2 [Dermacentor silvarum]|uniref:uncharacterized protein LOC119455475 isoform X2 n=1 Tax=Dermacentor silvarum TaxID=543639 RepID=UPI0021017B00|nr:uncharacterized protein LOC119455475 isoform X2 [Dermacentor silvarum]
MEASYLLGILGANATRNVTRLLSRESPFIVPNVSFQSPVTEAQQLLKGRRHEDFGAAGPVVVMLGCLFLMFLAVGIPTFIQKKRREARERREAILRLQATERREAAEGLSFRVPAMDS